MMVKVAAIVIHYKLDDLTTKTVNALLAQTYKPDVFVIDCCSPEPYNTDRCPVLRMHNPSSLTESLNWGMRLMRSYLVVWHVTNDVVPELDVLASLMEIMNHNPKLAAIQPSMPSSHPHLTPRKGGWDRVRYIEWSAPLVRQLSWSQVGRLDANFGFFSMDIDWCHRARQLGWLFAVDYRVRCDHLGGATHKAMRSDIAGYSAKEHNYGALKYRTEDWQELLTERAALCE